jgi:hypothetical protein
MDGILTQKETAECVELAVEACKQIYEVQKEALKKKYGLDKASESLEDEKLEEDDREADEAPVIEEEPKKEEEKDE